MSNTTELACVECQSPMKVKETYPTNEGALIRFYQCPACGLQMPRVADAPPKQ